MRQVVLTAPKQIEFREVAAPEAGNLKSDEVLLRILRIGICGSEIHSYNGQHPATFYPVVQGHEYSAEVVAVGSAVRKVKPGDRVTGRPQLVCGECNPCKRGQYNVCSNLRVEAFQADGVAQDYFVIPEERVVALPEGMSPDYGAMVTGWLRDGDAWYYLTSSGAMATGSRWIDGTRYAFDGEGRLMP